MLHKVVLWKSYIKQAKKDRKTRNNTMKKKGILFA